MDNFVDNRDFEILEKDRYTFFVLRRILSEECKFLLTDHRRLIICFSRDPFPVWVWIPDDADDDEKENAYRLVTEKFPHGKGFRFNMKYGLADHFIKKAAEEGTSLGILTNMLAYDCLEPVKPSAVADGNLHRCTAEDLDTLVEIIDSFQREVGVDAGNTDTYRSDAMAFIGSGKMFFWKDECGNCVASCKYSPNGDLASINLVYTRPEFRRKHYAENLVYRVTELAKQDGLIPMLYTDADYLASNACYAKIGYVLRGRLCTIG